MQLSFGFGRARFGAFEDLQVWPVCSCLSAALFALDPGHSVRCAWPCECASFSVTVSCAAGGGSATAHCRAQHGAPASPAGTPASPAGGRNSHPSATSASIL